MTNPARLLITRVTSLAHNCATIANVAGTLVVLIMVVVVNFDVVARGVFNSPFLGAVEVVQFSMVLIVFLQLPDVARANRLTRSDGFLMVVESRMPAVGRIIRIAIDLVSCCFMGLIAVAMWPEFVDMWASNDYFGVPGVFTAPWWPIKLVIFLSAALCSLIFVLKSLAAILDQGKFANQEPGSAQ